MSFPEWNESLEVSSWIKRLQDSFTYLQWLPWLDQTTSNIISRYVSLVDNYEDRDKSLEEILKYFSVILLPLKTEVLKAISSQDDIDYEKIMPILLLLSENEILAWFIKRLWDNYELWTTSIDSTDCIQILRQNPELMSIVQNSPTRFISEWSDLVFHENFGRVVDIVDSGNYQRLSQYKPRKDKLYIFALAKPPLTFQWKPNITHIQIPINLWDNKGRMSIIHASRNKGKVVIESDLETYLEHTPFERVFVIEVDLHSANNSDQEQRTPNLEFQDYDGARYTRPPLSYIPISPIEDFWIIWSDWIDYINPVKNSDVDITPEEIDTLNMLSWNQEMKIITLITAIREWKIWDWQNIKEAIAYWVWFDPETRSIWEYQITKVVAPLFNKWLDQITEHKAREFWEPILSFWEKKQRWENIEWSEVVPYIVNYWLHFKQGELSLWYKSNKVSTICAYLLLEDIFENELKSAYRLYDENPYMWLEEQPENIIMVAWAYRNNFDVMVTWSQQYRVAEIAYKMWLIDENFSFTIKSRWNRFYRNYSELIQKKYPFKYKFAWRDAPPEDWNKETRELFLNQFVIDGYRWDQMTFLTYLIYINEYPGNDYNLTYEDFKEAYSTTRTRMLSRKEIDWVTTEWSTKAVWVMHYIYEKYFWTRPKLFMTEGELRWEQWIWLNTSSIRFANEWLWAEWHFQKYVHENWEMVRGTQEYRDQLRYRSLTTNEVSKLHPSKVQVINSIIDNLPNRYYKKYRSELLTIAFDEKFISKVNIYGWNNLIAEEFLSLLDDIFITKVSELESKIWNLNDKEKISCWLLLSFMSVDSIRFLIENWLYDKEWSKVMDIDLYNIIWDLSSAIIQTWGHDFNYVDENWNLHSINLRNVLKVEDFPKSFSYLERRFNLKSYTKLSLKDKSTLDDKEKRDLFSIDVFRTAKELSERNWLSINLAYVITSMASYETWWWREQNEWWDLTLFSAANNIFSVKANYDQYTREEYENQDPDLPYYIHHTKEYIEASWILDLYQDGTVKRFIFWWKEFNVESKWWKYYITWENWKTIEFKQWKDENGAIYFECYEAFKKYKSIESAIQWLIDLLKKDRYAFTYDYSKLKWVLSIESIEDIFDSLVDEWYATDPKYADTWLSISKSIIRIMKEYWIDI